MHGYINDMIWNNKIQEVQEPLQFECQTPADVIQ